MLGVDDYGSDSDSSRPSSPKPQVPAPKPGAKRLPKKITFGLPALSSSKDVVEDKDDTDRPAKKRKTGSGVSSLLSMLPTPKESNPVPQPQRVLGSGSGPGLNFQRQSRMHDSVEDSRQGESSTGTPAFEPSSPSTDEPPSAALFRPTSVGKGRKNISVEESNSYQTSRPLKAAPSAPAPAVDFFSLGTTTVATSTLNASSSSSIVTPSSAPEIPTFEPPEPTPTDPYPGYYQLPSGGWAAHDAEYYGKFMKKWEKDYNAHLRSLEKGTMKGFEGLQDAAVEEIDAMKEMEKAKIEIQDREAKKAVTAGAGGAPAAPRMTINASKTNGVARSRHQLSTLLKEAYENREALEDRIAQGKRNRKEAGNKYGF